MDCSRCGSPSPEQASWCWNCGLKLRPGPRADAVGPPAATPPPRVLPKTPLADARLAAPGDGVTTLRSMGRGAPCGPTAAAAGATATATASSVRSLTRFERRRRLEELDASSGPLAVGQEFGRYVIIRLLGLGGMGAVYQAWDEELEVAVAVKVIRPEVMADLELAGELERRFKRELLLARQVTHKNVVRIHDLGELEGIKYITMSYVIGSELSAMLAQDEHLAVPKALHLVRGIVAGLVAAHEAGVVHRDLKPANIMVEEKTGEPLIMDFGIARSEGHPAGSEVSSGAAITPAAASSELTHATAAGGVVGTAAYMAPEQARGQEVDHRADLYSLGLIFYDLLLGQRRFAEGVSPAAELQARLDHAPPSPRSLDPHVPEAIDAVIMRCLAPDPADRYQSATDLAADLARLDDEGNPLPIQRRLTWGLVGIAAAGAMALAGATYWFTRPVPPPPLTSVLVADFEDRTNTPVFRGTLENALASGMEGASFITAYPRASAQQLASQIKPGSHLDPEMARLISAREGIKVVLAGRIEKRGEGFEVSVDAIDPAGNTVLASADATASSRDGVLTAVGATAARLRRGLGETAGESARLAASETVTASSLEALQAYTRAQELSGANRNQEALAAYQETVKLDPNFGRAYAGMGVLYSIAKDEVRAREAYDEALKRVDRMSEREKLRTLGTYYMMIARNYEKAIENYEALVKLYPADDGARGNLGLAYLYTGDVQRARAEASAVLEIYPKQWLQRYNYSQYSMYAGDFATAETEAIRVVNEAPTFELGALAIALSRLVQGDFTGALSTYDQLAQVSPAGASLARYGRADLEMYRGRHREALRMLRAAIPLDVKEGNTSTLAQNYLALSQASLAVGERAKAIDAARKAVPLSSHESVLLPAALVFIDVGRPDEAERIAATLEHMMQTHTTAYARMIHAQVAASQGDSGRAVELFRDSLKRRDTWFARMLLGKLYAQTEHYPEAMAELDLCVKRRGEALDVFFYDTPTARYLPPAYYWLARVQQSLGVADAGKNYGEFLALRAAADAPDPLAEDARRRVGN